eukprot:g30645.t1
MKEDASRPHSTAASRSHAAQDIGTCTRRTSFTLHCAKRAHSIHHGSSTPRRGVNGGRASRLRTAFWAVLLEACIAPTLGQGNGETLGLQADAEPGTLHWALAVILGLILIAGLIRSYRILKQTQHLTVVRHAPEGMRIVECGNCRTPQYVSAHGRIFICCTCHCANRIPLEIGRSEELIVPEGPLKKFEFKKGGENYWQEGSEMFEQDKARVALKNQRRNAHVVKPLKDLPDRDHWEALLTTNWQNLIDAPASVKADFRCIEIATKQTWKALRYAAEELRDDPVFVLPMVESCWWALECLGDNARRDEEVAAAALKQSSLAFECLPPEMREDLITLQEAVRSDGTALRYASKENGKCASERLAPGPGGLEGSKGFVESSGIFLERANSSLWTPKLRKDGLSLQYVSPILKADTSVVLAALQQNGEALEFAPEKFQSSRKVVDVAVKQNPRALRFASETLRSDEELVKEVAQVDGSVLQYASETLCANKRVVNKAVLRLVDTLRTGSKDWRAIKEILRKNPDPPEDFLVEAATINPEIVRAQELRGHRSVAAAALEGNGLMLRGSSDHVIVFAQPFACGFCAVRVLLRHYLLPDLRADQELASIAVRQNPDAMGEVHPCLRRENDLLKLQKDGLVRRARLELRRRRAKSDTVAAEAVADHEMDRDGDVADWTEPIPEKLPEMLPDPPDPKMEKEISQEELEDGADVSPTSSRPPRAAEENDVGKVAASIIGKVDVESASGAEDGLPQCVVLQLRQAQARLYLLSYFNEVMLYRSHASHMLRWQAQAWLCRSLSRSRASTSTPATSSTSLPELGGTTSVAPREETTSVAIPGPSKVSDIVFKGALDEDLKGGARHAPVVSRLWSNVPVHVRESFKAPATLDEAPTPSSPLLVDRVLSGVKQLAARSGLAPAHWASDVARPYYGGRIPLAPYQKGQTAAYNYPKLMQSEVREKQRVCFGERFLAGTRAAGQRGSLYGAVNKAENPDVWLKRVGRWLETSDDTDPAQNLVYAL